MPVTVAGVDDVIARLALAAARARAPREALEREASELAAIIDRAWATRRSPGGVAWPPRKGAGSDRLAVAHVVTATDTGIRVTAPSPAGWVFFGTSRAPARNPLPLEPSGAGYRWTDSGYVESMRARIAAHVAAAVEPEE